jgi:hypothetical protein
MRTGYGAYLLTRIADGKSVRLGQGRRAGIGIYPPIPSKAVSPARRSR